MVVTPKGYTKHYYNGSQRIAARIGKLEDLPVDVIDTSAVAMPIPRDAGNMLAGAVKYRSGILAPIVQYGYGAYNLSGNNFLKSVALIIGNMEVLSQSVPLGVAAAVLIYNGEDKLTQRSINIGYKYIR